MGFFVTLLYLALSLIRPAELFPWLARFHVMDVAAGLAVAATAISMVGGRRPSFRSPQLYVAVAFVAWAAFSVFAAQRWLGGAVDTLQALGTSGFLFLLITLNADSLPRLEWIRRLLILLALWLVIQGAAALFFGYREATFVLHERPREVLEGGGAGWDVEQDLEAVEPGDSAGGGVRRIRALGFLQDPNDLAQALAAILPLVFLEWRSRRPLGNVLLVLTPAALLLAGIALTRSRGGLLAVAAMAIAAAIHFGNRIVSALSLAASGVCLIAGLALVRTYVLRDESSFGRVQAWYEGLQMIKKSPIWGVGFGGFTDYNELVAHNSFVHCFAELGAVGYFLWLAMFVVTFHDLAVIRRVSAARGPHAGDVLADDLRRWGAAAGLALVGFLVGAFFLSRSYSTTLFIFLALPTALADVARRSGRPVAPFSPVPWGVLIAALQVATLVIAHGMVRLVR